MGGWGRTQKAIKKSHEIIIISTLKRPNNSLKNVVNVGFFYCHPQPNGFTYDRGGRVRGGVGSIPHMGGCFLLVIYILGQNLTRYRPDFFFSGSIIFFCFPSISFSVPEPSGSLRKTAKTEKKWLLIARSKILRVWRAFLLLQIFKKLFLQNVQKKLNFQNI